MRPNLLLVGMLVFVVGFAPAPFPRQRKGPVDDPRLLQGTWKVIRYEASGADWLPQVTTPIWRVVKDQMHVIQVLPGGQEKINTTYELRLDQTKQPRTFDLCQGGKAQYVGIYTVDRHRWQVVFTHAAANGGNRPTRFSSAGAYLVVLQRQGR